MINGFENILFFFSFFFFNYYYCCFSILQGKVCDAANRSGYLAWLKTAEKRILSCWKKRSLEERKRLFSPRRSKHHHRHWLVSINMYSAFMVMNGMLLFNLINVSIINLMTLRVHMDQIRMFFVSLHWFALTLWCLIVVRPCSLHWILEF